MTREQSNNTNLTDTPPKKPKNRPWTLEELLSYRPVHEALKGEWTQTEIAERFGINQSQLSKLIGYVEKIDPTLVPAKFRNRARRGSKLVHLYPVYGKVQAGLFNGSDQLLPGDASEEFYYSATELEPGERGEPYVLEIRGESMTDGAASVDFPEGTKALINPNVLPASGDFAVVFDARDSTTTIKKVVAREGEEWLVPLNPMFQPFRLDPEYHQYAGVVEEAMKPLYRRQDGVKRRRR